MTKTRFLGTLLTFLSFPVMLHGGSVAYSHLVLHRPLGTGPVLDRLFTMPGWVGLVIAAAGLLCGALGWWLAKRADAQESAAETQ